MKHQFLSLGLLIACYATIATSSAATHIPLTAVTTNSAAVVLETKSSCVRMEHFNSTLNLELADGEISERKAASIAKAAYGGTVMSVTRSGNVYRVKLLQEGRVRIVRVNANTGAIE